MRAIGRPREDGVDAAGKDPLGPFPLERVNGLNEGAGRIDHVVNDDHVLALHVADEVHEEGDVRAFAPLVDDGKPGAEPLGDRPSPLHPAGVRRDDHQSRSVSSSTGSR